MPVNEVSWEFDNLLISLDKWSLKRVILEPTTCKALIITCIIMLGQQMSGINAVTIYNLFV